MFVTVNGVDLYYEKKGKGQTLLMLHGNGEDHEIFQEAVEALSVHFECYVLDSRSHGHSTVVEELHYRDMARDIIAFIEEMDLEDLILYGFSDGGIIGLMVAAHCDRVKELIISGANVKPNGVKTMVGIAMKIEYLFKRDPKVKLMLKEPHISKRELERIKARTLVLAGEHDVIKEKETRFIAAHIPGSTLRILKEENHGSYIVHSTKIADEILSFSENIDMK